jgi:hypothetical protein
MAYSRGLELKTISRMVSIYCQDMHTGGGKELCLECRQLLDYAEQRMDKCPLGEDKPVCSRCTVHCFKPKMRDSVKQVMRYSGPRMLWKSPVLTVRYMYRKKFKSTL